MKKQVVSLQKIFPFFLFFSIVLCEKQEKRQHYNLVQQRGNIIIGLSRQRPAAISNSWVTQIPKNNKKVLLFDLSQQHYRNEPNEHTVVKNDIKRESDIW